MPMIEYTKESRIAIFTINRPEVLGAFNVQLMKELDDALYDFRDDDQLLVGIITGTGEKAFCVGADIEDFLPFIKRVMGKQWHIPGAIMRRFELWKPLIAACNGLAYGGGLEIALACDIRIASENAKFGLPEVTHGVVPGGGGTQRLARLIPPGIAAEMLFTGKPIDAREAYRVGLVNKVVPQHQLMPTAKELAETICKNGPVAVRLTKEALIRGAGMSLEDGLRFEESFTQFNANTKDFLEGITAFEEKRKPKFEGK